MKIYWPSISVLLIPLPPTSVIRRKIAFFRTDGILAALSKYFLRNASVVLQVWMVPGERYREQEEKTR